MPEPTDPTDPIDPAFEARLARLAPGIDPDAATTAFSGRRVARARHRRMVMGGGIAAAVLILVGLVALLALPADDGEQVRAGQGTEPTASTAPEGLVEGERRVESTDRGITMVMDLPETVTVGARMWVEVSVTNDRDQAVTIGTAAPCTEPIRVLAGSIEAINSVQAATSPVDVGEDTTVGSSMAWDGDLATLPAVLADVQAPKLYRGRDESQMGTSSTVCEDILLPPEELAPGASLTRRIAVDLRWVGPEPVDGQEFDVLVETGVVKEGEMKFGGEDLGTFSLRQPVRLFDPTDRAPSHAAATGPDGMAAAPTLPEWLTMTGDLGGSLVLEYTASLTWWNGAWETWIDPAMGTGQQTDALRIRFDPEEMEVVDVRTVFWNLAPSDDPDFEPQPDGSAVDEIRYQG